jgi:hypothetical protein
MENFAAVAKNILIHVLSLGNLYGYGMPSLFYECDKSNKKNSFTAIYVFSKDIFKENQLYRFFFISTTDSKYSITSATHNDYNKQLVNVNCFSLNSFVSLKHILSEHTNNIGFNFHLKIFSTRPPPF